MKKIIALFLTLAMLGSLAACGGSTTEEVGSSEPSAEAETVVEEEEPLNVVFAAENSLGSQSFLDVCVEGLQNACDEVGGKLTIIQEVETSTVADTMRTAIANGAQVIVIATTAWNEAFTEVAAEFPDIPFVNLDSDGTGAMAGEYSNIYEVSYKEHEAAFLNGVFVSLMTESGKVAQIQGADTGTMVRFNSGFRAGVQYVLDIDPPTSVVGYADVNKGYETAMLYYDQGYDWLACCAGGSNLGVFQASQEKGGDYWCCGAADGQFHLMPDRIVCSQVKTIDQVAYSYIKGIVENGDSRGGQWDVLGVAEGGVDLIFNDQNEDVLEIVSEEVMEMYNAIREQIISGELQIPSTPEELETFTARFEK